MRALVKAKPEPGIWMEDVQRPATGPNDVLISVKKTSICGTDLHIIAWDEWARTTIPTPMTIGHEYVGTVAEIGSEVEGLEIGQRVSGEGHIVCGRCRNCQAGRRHLCINTVGVGVDRTLDEKNARPLLLQEQDRGREPVGRPSITTFAGTGMDRGPRGGADPREEACRGGLGVRAGEKNGPAVAGDDSDRLQGLESVVDRVHLQLGIRRHFQGIESLAQTPAKGSTAAPDDELSPAEQAWLADHPVIRLAPDPDFPSIESIDANGVYQGIAADYMEIVEERIGIQFQVIRCSDWDDVLKRARNHEVDVLPAAANTPDRRKYLLFTEPYLVLPGIIISRRDSRSIDSLDKVLAGEKIGVVRGYVWQEMIERNYPDLELVLDRKSTRLNSSHTDISRMPSSA